LPDTDKTKIEQAIDTTLRWLESNPGAPKSEIEEKQKELENIIQPIMAKLYQGSQHQGTHQQQGEPQGRPRTQKTDEGGPTIDEID